MAPGYSSLRGYNRPNWENPKAWYFIADKPAIPMEEPKKKKKDKTITTTGVDPNYVPHEIYYEKGSQEKYIKNVYKLKEDSSPEDYCCWRESIGELLAAKGPTPFDLVKKIILSCMEAGERAKLFSNKVDEFMIKDTRKLAKAAAKEAAAAAAAAAAATEEPKTPTGDNPQAQSSKKKKKKDKQKPDKEEAPIPRKERDTPATIDRYYDIPIWRALNEVALTIFPKGAEDARIQREYLMHSLQFAMGNKKPETYNNRLVKVANYKRFFPLDTEEWSPTKRHPPLLEEGDLISISLKSVKPQMLTQLKIMGKTRSKFTTLAELTKFLKQLYEGEQLQKQLDQIHQSKRKSGNDSDEERPRKKRRKGNNNNQSKGGHNHSKSGRGNKRCSICKQNGHEEDDCWFNEDNPNQPKWAV
jgi:Ni/Co efflux regulator RcnB